MEQNEHREAKTDQGAVPVSYTHLDVYKRQAAERAIPKDWAQKEKLGFPVPVVNWLRQERYYDEIKAWFTGEIAQRFFNTDELVRLLDEHKAGADRSRKIWIVDVYKRQRPRRSSRCA